MLVIDRPDGRTDLRPPRAGIAVRIGRWSARHRVKAVAIWLLFVVLCSAFGATLGTRNATSTERSVTPVPQILADAGLTPPAGEVVLLQSATLTATDPAFTAAVQTVAATVRSAPDTADVVLPETSGAVSADGHSALISFSVTGDPATAQDRVSPVLDAVDALDVPGVAISEVGDASAELRLTSTFNDDFAKAEWTAVPVALGILLVVFASVVAAVLPVVLALTAYTAAAGLAALASHALPTTEDAGSVMLLVGLAVGVDYCLFYLRRMRDERAAGRSVAEAIDIAVTRSGRTVLVSGATVIAAMAGLFLTGILDFEAIAVSTIVVVAVAVLGSLTALPALMSLLGDRVDSLRLPSLPSLPSLPFLRKRAGRRGPVTALLGVVVRRPVRAAVISGALLLALAAPVLTMHTAQLSTTQELSPDNPIVTTSEAIAAAFPGSAAPATVVLQVPDVSSPAVGAALTAFRERVAADPAEFSAATVTVHAPQQLAVITLGLAGSGVDDVSQAALTALRDDVVAPTLGSLPGATVSIGGVTAESTQFTDTLDARALPVFGFVLVLALLVMLSAFRSVAIAGITVVLNLLSVGAAYGVLTLVFQHDVGSSLVGAHPVGAINAWVPIFLFVVLFGLSMDYHVFVVSSIREQWAAGVPTREAVRRGVGASSGVVTSAALIMVGVFSIFATLSVESMKQIAVGLACAIVIDATLIRAVLLPALIAAFGERSWYLPRWLRWVPSIEGADTALSPLTIGGLAPAAGELPAAPAAAISGQSTTVSSGEPVAPPEPQEEDRPLVGSRG